MTAYWLVFAFFAAGAFPTRRDAVEKLKRLKPFFVLGAIIVTLFVGLRYKVGADWNAYEMMYRYSGRLDFARAFRAGDPAYQALNWASFQIDGGIWLVNLVCAAIFSWGLFRFCAVQAKPWAAVLAALAYTVIVVAMGYTRQAVALGILMAGLAAVLRGGSTFRFAVYVLVAALFHRTAIVMFPIVALALQRNRAVNLLLVVATSYLFYDLFLGDSMDNFVDNYIKRNYSSQGAAIRIAMSLVAAAIFAFARPRLDFSELELRLWRNFSLVTVGLLILLLTLPSSTAVDRLSLYVVPLQFAVWARVPAAAAVAYRRHHGGGRLRLRDPVRVAELCAVCAVVGYPTASSRSNERSRRLR